MPVAEPCSLPYLQVPNSIFCFDTWNNHWLNHRMTATALWQGTWRFSAIQLTWPLGSVFFLSANSYQASCVLTWGWNGREARCAWSVLEMSYALCWCLKNTLIQKWAYGIFHEPVPWDSLAPEFNCNPVKPCLLLHSLFPCLPQGPETEIKFLVGITRFCSEGHHRRWISQ